MTVALIATVTLGSSCQKNGDRNPALVPSVVLRVGVAQVTAANPINGLRQVAQLLAVEGLARLGEDGRMQPWLAENWSSTNAGRGLLVNLRSNARFHDGSQLNADSIATILPDALRSFMGPLSSDFDYVRAVGTNSVEIGFRAASPFLLESLEVSIQKPGNPMIGTGPFMLVPNSTTELRVNPHYYLGRSPIERIQVANYPSVRAAWADMLRNRLDVLWDVGADALNSMKNSSTVSVFAFTRRYQHVMAFNSHSAALKSANVRRALSLAVDRAAVVHNALNDYGIASEGPIWLHHWALRENLPHFEFQPSQAADILRSSRRNATPLRFTCLVSPDSRDERIALEVKRQLAAIGVDMMIEEASRDQIVQRAGKQQFEAAIFEVVSGPTLFRPYLVWHSKAPLNWGDFGNQTVDAALDQLRRAPSEDTYRLAVDNLQKSFMDDPPAIFLAWSITSRAVSNQFVVSAPEPGRDILSTLRLWKPATDRTPASRN